MAIRKKGLTVEHGALLACGIKTVRTIREFDEWSKDDHPKVIVDVGEGRSLACTQENKLVIKLWLTDLVQLLQEELELILDISLYNSAPEGFKKPHCESSIIQMVKLVTGEFVSEFTCALSHAISFGRSLMTYESLAEWFIHHKEFEMAKRISPPMLEAYNRLNTPLAKFKPPQLNHLIKTPKTMTNTKSTQKPDFESDDIPTNLYLAYSVSKEVWNDIPENMRNPTKVQLTEYLQQKGVNVAADIGEFTRP